MSSLEIAVVAAYGLVLLVLSVYGSHRYFMAYLYYRHKYNAPDPGRRRCDRAAAGHRPAPHLQRDVRGRAAHRRGLRARLPAGPAARSRSSTTRPTRPPAIAAGQRSSAGAPGARHRLHPPHRPAGLQGGRAGARPRDRHGRVRRHLRRRLRPAAATSSARRSTTSPTTASGMVQVALGAPEPRLLARSPRSRRSCSTATSSSSTPRATAPAASSTSTAPPASGAAAPSTTPAAGSTTRSPRTSTSPTAPSSRAGSFVYLPEVVAPAELPVEMNAFKSQQHRWAKGSIQTAMKLLPRILRADLPLRGEEGGVLPPHRQPRLPPHDPARHPACPSRWWCASATAAIEVLLLDLPFFVAATTERVRASTWRASGRSRPPPVAAHQVPALPHGARHRPLGEPGPRRRRGAARAPDRLHPHAQERRPGRRPAPRPERRYRVAVSLQPLLELALAAYFTLRPWSGSSTAGVWYSLPFLVLFQVGFAYVGAHERHRGAARLLGPLRPGAAAGRRRGVTGAAAAALQQLLVQGDRRRPSRSTGAKPIRSQKARAPAFSSATESRRARKPVARAAPPRGRAAASRPSPRPWQRLAGGAGGRRGPLPARASGAGGRRAPAAGPPAAGQSSSSRRVGVGLGVGEEVGGGVRRRRGRRRCARSRRVWPARHVLQGREVATAEAGRASRRGGPEGRHARPLPEALRPRATASSGRGRRASRVASTPSAPAPRSSSAPKRPVATASDRDAVPRGPPRRRAACRPPPARRRARAARRSRLAPRSRAARHDALAGLAVVGEAGDGLRAPLEEAVDARRGPA